MTKEIDAVEPNAVADIPGPNLDAKTPRCRAPAGSVDCHIHVMGDPNRIPLNPGRQYTPAEADLDLLRARNNVIGIDNVVIVQPSTYGINNDFICEQVKAMGKHGRGIAVTDITTPEKDLEMLNDAGYMGTRFNVAASGGTPLSELATIAERIAPLGWNIQFFLFTSQSMVELADQIGKLPVPVVVDHMGAPDLTKGGPEQPGFQALINLMKEGNTFVKLCGAYRLDFGDNPWSKADPFARALIEAAPDQCVWGSDWPHPYCVNPATGVLGHVPNDGDLFDRLLAWTDNDDALLQKILVDTPKKLYGFNE